MGKPNIIKLKLKNNTDKSWKNEMDDFYNDLKKKKFENKIKKFNRSS